MLRNILRTSRWLARRQINNFAPILLRHYVASFKSSISVPINRRFSANPTDTTLTSDVDPVVFDEVCNETLESLCDYFEELAEQFSSLKGADITYSDGVLTVALGPAYGTYVINRQTPNKQIWLSSPVSGPKRYDLILKNGGYWIYKHDGVSLHQLLQEEMTKLLNDQVDFNKIPILLQRDLEYYQKNQTVLSETICRGVVGGRLDFPRNASFASVKIVLWLEEEFSIAFKQGSGMFVTTEDDEEGDMSVAKTSDPDKFIQLAIKSSDSLLEHLHMLAQEALDHADLPVLTATLGAAALLKNSLYCYVQHVEDTGNTDKLTQLQACYKRYVTMSEAVAERVLDLHNRVLSLYILQDSGGRPIDGHTKSVLETGTPSVQGWWLYMNGSRKDLWDTVPPRMAQRIFAGMLNETLTILTVRYCQTNTTVKTTPLLLNDILNILLCVAQLLPSICSTGSELAGLEVTQHSRDVRDVHAKCNELFKCFVFRGAELHFIHQAFKENNGQPSTEAKDTPFPWFTFVSPKLFDNHLEDITAKSTLELPDKTAIGLELIVLLAQPQPSWSSVVKVLMMRNCLLSRSLLVRGVAGTPAHNTRRAHRARWYTATHKCSGFLCTADGYCTFQGDGEPGEEFAKASGALTYILATIGSKAEFKSTLCYALEISGKDWAACLDKRQVWCDRRPAWLAGIMGIVGSALQFIPPILVNAVQRGASMYQTMSLCLSCVSRTLDCIPRTFFNACSILETTLPSHINPVGGCVLLQMLITIVYEEIQKWAKKEAAIEKAAISANGEPHTMSKSHKPRMKQVRIAGLATATSSVSFDSSHSTPSSIALAIAEALCSIDEDDKHTGEIRQLVAQTKKTFKLSNQFGLEDFPEFADMFEEGDVPGSNAERASDAAALTSQILMTPTGRDSLRVMYEHIQLHSEWIYKELGIQESGDVEVPLNKAPLLYIMFHIGRQPFDQYLRGEWPMPWSKLVSAAAARGGLGPGARAHAARRADLRDLKLNPKTNPHLLQLYHMFKSPDDGLL